MYSVTQTIQLILFYFYFTSKTEMKHCVANQKSEIFKSESKRQYHLNFRDFVGILTHSYETICGKNKNTVTFMNSLTQTINSIYYLNPKTEIKRSSITSPTFMLQRPYETIIFFQASNKPGVRGSWNID